MNEFRAGISAMQSRGLNKLWQNQYTLIIVCSLKRQNVYPAVNYETARGAFIDTQVH